MSRSSSWMVAGGVALVLVVTVSIGVGAQGQRKNPEEATLVLTTVNNACTPTKPDVTISRKASPKGLKWIVDNQCDAELDVEVFGFAPGTSASCAAPAGSKPFNENSGKEKVAKKTKKAFSKDFTLGKDNGCWTYKVKVGTATFDPQIRVDQ